MKTIIFDFDGTLADSFELAFEIAGELADTKHVDQAEIDRLRQMPLAKVIRELHVPIRLLPKLIIVGRQMMHERLHEVQPFPGTEETLKGLQQDGNHLLVMSSNSEQNVRSFLRTHKLEHYFDGVYGGASVLNKGSALKKVIKKNKIDKKTCYYVGDEVRDIVAASKAGVEPVAVAWGYQAPEALYRYHPLALVKSPAELLAVFRSNKV